MEGKAMKVMNIRKMPALQCEKGENPTRMSLAKVTDIHSNNPRKAIQRRKECKLMKVTRIH
jgi:hypothetical protein